MEVASTAATATARESWWVLSVSLAAKCGASGSSLSLFSFLLFLLLTWLLVGLLCWTAPGGPAWGRYWWGRGKRGVLKSIPGPRGLPFLGSMGLMAGLAHRQLAGAAKTFDAKRLMAFSLGETRAIVTSDPEVAKEILNGSAFVDRPMKESAYGLLFHRAIGFAPYGVYWRTLRRIAAAHLFCPKQISSSEPHRLQIARQMVAALGRSVGGVVRARDIFKQASLNNVMLSVFGRGYDIGGGENCSPDVVELRELVEEGYELLGKLNWADHIPLLVDFDLQRIRSRCSNLVPRVYSFVKKIIAEHSAFKASGATAAGAAHDFVDVLLSLQGDDRLSDDDIIAVLWEMIFRGTDTVAVLMEWAMARLVLHPEVQRKVHEELDRVIGPSRAVAEPDVAELPYLNAVLKETLRLHPPGPLMSWARLSIRDTVVDDRHVPAGTTAMVNMWAITHDPNVWEEPLEFRPERFLTGAGKEVEVSVFGSDLRLAPFGSGRRSCPGKALGMATVGFWMASLLHEYDWLLPSQQPSDGKRGWTDLDEVLRLSCEMAVPLTVEVHPRRR